MAVPGEVYYLPPQEGEIVDPSKGERPHLALSLCAPASDVVTLAYGSTRATEASMGAAHVLVDPRSRPGQGTGISRPTYFYPSRLVSLMIEDLPSPAGRIVDDMPRVRSALRSALGLGSGTTTDPNVAGSNRRGRIAILSKRMQSITGFAHAVVITEPGYSRLSRQQTLVPAFPESAFETGYLDVVAPVSRWTRHVTSEREPIVLATSMVFTVFQREWIEGYAPAVLDPMTIHRLDEALVQHFGLERTR